MDIQNSFTPALLGGPRAVRADHAANNRWPQLTAEDEAAVLRVLREGNISTHPVIRELEQDYAAFSGRRFALAGSAGRALFGHRLGPGRQRFERRERRKQFGCGHRREGGLPA